MSLTTASPVSADPWVTTSYCSACWRRHPGLCGCVCHRPSAASRDHWTAALKYYGTGRTAQAHRALADSPAMVAGLAFIDGITPAEMRAEMAATADAIGQYAAAGLTPEGAYFLAGLDRDLGAYEDNRALSAA